MQKPDQGLYNMGCTIFRTLVLIMWTTAAVLWCSAVSLTWSHTTHFPTWFKFGSATSSYQVEGAWNVSDKGESKLDRLAHQYPEMMADNSNGDDACNSYYLWQRDVDMAAELGLQFYRLSINWPRLLPTGYADYISEDGKNYYNNLIDGLLEKGVEPVITLYHWEMPQVFQDLGGWGNPLSADWFAEYARVVYSLYADRVKTWITINEPIVECDWEYLQLIIAPQLEYFVDPYLCNKNILLAHAKAWRIYDEEYKSQFNGKVSISNHLLWLMPNSHQDEQLTETAREFFTGRYSHPIYSKEGGWPPVVEEKIATVSQILGFQQSRLPPFTEEEIELIRGTFDYYAMNYYTTRLVSPATPNDAISSNFLSYIPYLHAALKPNLTWTYGYSQDMPIHPEGLRQQIGWLKQKYGDIEILITENGLSSAGFNVDDDDRVLFIKDHLEQVLLAIEDGVKVSGYTYWTIMDNFEWTSGYLSKFGLYEVDFSDPQRQRTPRKSAHYYSDIIKTRTLRDP